MAAETSPVKAPDFWSAQFRAPLGSVSIFSRALRFVQPLVGAAEHIVRPVARARVGDADRYAAADGLVVVAGNGHHAHTMENALGDGARAVDVGVRENDGE